MTELLLEGPESMQRHTHLRLQQVQLASFTSGDGRFVYFDRTSEKPAQLWAAVTVSRSICVIGPLVGISLVVGPTPVVSPTISLSEHDLKV